MATQTKGEKVEETLKALIYTHPHKYTRIHTYSHT
jgi:hypothetical protein